MKKNNIYENRTKSAQSGGLERTGQEREFRVAARITRCGGLCTKAGGC